MNYPGRIIKKGEKDSVIVKAVQERLKKISNSKATNDPSLIKPGFKGRFLP